MLTGEAVLMGAGSMPTCGKGTGGAGGQHMQVALAFEAHLRPPFRLLFGSFWLRKLVT